MDLIGSRTVVESSIPSRRKDSAVIRVYTESEEFEIMKKGVEQLLMFVIYGLQGDRHRSISIAGRTTDNLRFADDAALITS